MSNSFFERGEQRAPKVNALFDQIAPRYDLINDLQSFGLHRYWKRRLLQLGQIKPGVVALDLCCGTADLALAMAVQGGRVVGLDFSEQMLMIAQRRKHEVEDSRNSTASINGKQGVADLAFIRADAQRIPFQDNSFDIVTVGYGLRNLADWQAGLQEMLRVAKPGARLLVLDFGKPSNPASRSLYYLYLRLVVPLFGRVFAGSWQAYSYILESLKQYPAQKGVADFMGSLRMQNVTTVNLLGGMMSVNYGQKPGAIG
jgi:demethylmenaquinone methyltransferase/2-methoxy-6-polyprenyl-1,4-benzoquinol methylase